jgi:hypothetical protein
MPRIAIANMTGQKLLTVEGRFIIRCEGEERDDLIIFSDPEHAEAFCRGARVAKECRPLVLAD